VRPHDCASEELIEDVDFGLYVGGRGLKGGQVEPGTGTFTFGVGPSKIIKNGELGDTVRGVVISGSILDTLKTMDAVGKDLRVSTMVFGGCGKMSQSVFVGDGGPQVRVRKMTVGGQ
jgi:TldD protein